MRQLGTTWSERTPRLAAGSAITYTLGERTGYLAVSLFLGLAVPLMAGLPGSTGSRSAGVILGLLIAVAATMIARNLAQGGSNFIELTFWLFVYVWGGLAALAQGSFAKYPLPGVYSDAEVVTASVILALGVAGWVGGRSVANSRPQKPGHGRQVDERRVEVVAAIAVVLAGLGVQRVGLGTFFTSREEASMAWSTAVGGSDANGQIVRAMTSVPAAAAMYLVLFLRRSRGIDSLRLRFFTALLACAVAVVANPITNSRFLFGSILFAWFIAYAGKMSSKQSRATAAAIVLGVLLIFPTADRFRKDERKMASVSFSVELLQGGDYDAFQQTMNGVRLVDVGGLSKGKHAVGDALFWIPRSVWADKPEPVGSAIAEASGYSFQNLSSPFWIEGYVDFGLVGTIGMGVFLGYYSRRIERASFGDGLTFPAAIGPFFAAFQLVLLRGSIMGVISLLAAWAAVVYFGTTSIRTRAVA
jgi:hypothetical protein